MTVITEIAWSGGIPGYGDAVLNGWRICEPNAIRMHYSDGRVLALPEPAHAVAISDGLQLAWEGADTGLLYRELVSTGIPTNGDHSFLWQGETLQSFTSDDAGKAIYQATAGGWRYVDDGGALVAYGPTYSGPPLWNRIAHGNVTIGQGPNDGDGLCVTIDGGPVRQFVPGNWNDLTFRRYGDTCIVLAVEYSQHVTRVWSVTVAELAVCPLLAAPPAPDSIPPPAPIPVAPAPPVSEVPPVSAPGSSADNPKITSSLVAADLAAAVSASWLGTHGAPIDPSNLAYWHGWASTPQQFSDGVWRLGWNRYGEDRMSPTNTGSANPADGDLPALFQPGTAPAPAPQPVPAPVDLTAILARLAALEAAEADMLDQIHQLEGAAPVGVTAAQLAAALTGYAKHGDPVRVSGSVTTYGLKSNQATWSGTL